MAADWDIPTERIAVREQDRRVELMQTFVELDERIAEMREHNNRLGEEIDAASAKQREIWQQLGDALGFDDGRAMKAATR